MQLHDAEANEFNRQASGWLTLVVQVPLQAVGFLLGQKGGTLRQLETRHARDRMTSAWSDWLVPGRFRTFMFFDNDNVRSGAKRLYIISPSRSCSRGWGECARMLITARVEHTPCSTPCLLCM